MPIPQQSKLVDNFELPKCIRRDRTLDRTTKHVLYALATYRNHRTGQARPTQATLAADTGCDCRTIVTCIGKAIDLGWVIKLKKGHRGTSSEYLLNPPVISEPRSSNLIGEARSPNSGIGETTARISENGSTHLVNAVHPNKENQIKEQPARIILSDEDFASLTQSVRAGRTTPMTQISETEVSQGEK